MVERKKPASKKTKKTAQKKPDYADDLLQQELLDAIEAEFATSLRNKTVSAIERGQILLRARDANKKKREWTAWMNKVSDKYDVAVRTITNLCNLGDYVKRLGNSAKFADLSYIATTVLYDLATGDTYSPEAEVEIWRQAKSKVYVGLSRAEEIERRIMAAKAEAEATEKSEPEPAPEPEPDREKTPNKERPDLDPLFDQINAKLAATGDPRRLTWLNSPLIGLTYALEGPQRPDGQPDISGGLDHDDLERLAEELEEPAPEPAPAPDAPESSAPPPEPEPASESAESAQAGAAKAETGKAEERLPQPIARDPVLADFDATVTRLNSFTSKFLGSFDGSHFDVDTFERVGRFFLNLADRKRGQSSDGPTDAPPPPPSPDPLDVRAQPWTQRNPAYELAKAQIEQEQAEQKKRKAQGRIAKLKADKAGERRQMPAQGKDAMRKVFGKMSKQLTKAITKEDN